MHKPIRDALDRTAGTAVSSRPEHEASAELFPASPEEANARCAEVARRATASMIDARRSRVLPFSRFLPRGIRRALLGASVAVALAMGAVAGTAGSASAATPVDLGDAAPFGVLAGVSVTNANSTDVTGDLGVSPGATVFGFPPGVVSGTKHQGDATAAAAKADALAASADIASRPSDATLGTQLGGTTRGPGVYDSASGDFTISGTLTLDAQGDPDAVFIFRTTLLNAANVSNINLLRGAQADNVFWRVTDTATLGSYCTFRGNILAQNFVTVNTGVNLNGRAFALGDTVSIQGTTSLPHTRITVPNDPPTTTTLTSSLNPAWKGDPVTLTATVNAVSGPVVPAGEVVFKDGSTVLGTAWTSSSGPARITVSDLSAGVHEIVAVYLGGDTFDNEAFIHFAPSTSPAVAQDMSDSLWDKAATPAVPSQPDTQAITVGVKFRASTGGTVTAIRFYKGSQNTGTHTGSLWTSNGNLLSTATFTGETASGWQEASFPAPVAITANTTYIASYHTTSGRYSITRPYFTSSYNNGPLTALANGTDGGNGVYTYGATSTFPTSSTQSTNYWVDLVFIPTDSLWDETATPAVPSQPDAQGVSVGVKFRTTTNGAVSGIRFYKGSQNTGTHTVSLWAGNGQLLASAPVTGETASGWQQVNFPAPVNVTANTTYIASYHTTSGRYSVTRPYFTSQYANGALVALADGASGGNGVYTYNANNIFPTSNYQATNYWVDPIFHS